MMLCLAAVLGFILHARRDGRQIKEQRRRLHARADQLHARAEEEERRRQAAEEELLKVRVQLREAQEAAGTVMVSVQIKVAVGA